MLKFSILVLLFGIAWSGDADTDDCDSGDIENWAIDFTGKSTKFEFYSVCEKDKAYIRIEMKEATENYITDKGEEAVSDNKITSFSSDEYDWESSNGTQGTYGDNDCAGIVNKFSGTDFEVGKDKDLVGVSIETVLFEEDCSVTVNDDDEDVYEFELKFSINITNWPWLNSSNTFQLFMEVETKEIKTKDKDDDDDDDKYVSYVFGDEFNLDVPTEYLCGDELRAVNTTVETKDGEKIDLYFDFEYCDSAIMYFDPFIYAADNKAANQNIVFIAVMALLAMVWNVL